MLYRRLATDRSLALGASIDTQASTINIHAARPVYQMRASIINATPPPTKYTPRRPRKTSARDSAVLGPDGGFSFADLQHHLQADVRSVPTHDVAGRHALSPHHRAISQIPRLASCVVMSC